MIPEHLIVKLHRSVNGDIGSARLTTLCLTETVGEVCGREPARGTDRLVVAGAWPRRQRIRVDPELVVSLQRHLADLDDAVDVVEFDEVRLDGRHRILNGILPLCREVIPHHLVHHPT